MDIFSEAFQWIHQQGHCCLHCGSFWPTPSQFCKECEKTLWSRHSRIGVSKIGHQPVKVQSLFAWVPDEDRQVSKLMIAFKGGQLKSTSRFYAERFVSLLHGNFLPPHAVLVPCPGTKDRAHAQTLAASFSEILKIPVQDILRKTASRAEQKHRTLYERYMTEFQCLQSVEKRHVIFIDDIVTTGATALSAQRALGQTQKFEVWSLARRCQLATNSAL